MSALQVVVQMGGVSYRSGQHAGPAEQMATVRAVHAALTGCGLVPVVQVSGALAAELTDPRVAAEVRSARTLRAMTQAAARRLAGQDGDG